MNHPIKADNKWNPSLYDEQHAFVSQYGSNLIDLLNPKPGEYILDLGCGTGDIANALTEKGVHVKGIDSSEDMINRARQKYPHIPFLKADATALTEINTYQAVFSNAVMHWITDPEKALDSIYHSLQIGGRFVAEFGAKGNVEQITSTIKKQAKKLHIPYDNTKFPWYFPSIGEYTTLMENTGFHVTYARIFDRPTILKGEDGLENWINMFGQSMFKHISKPSREQLVKAVENSLRDKIYLNNEWVADYKRIQIIGLKVK